MSQFQSPRTIHHQLAFTLHHSVHRDGMPGGVKGGTSICTDQAHSISTFNTKIICGSKPAITQGNTGCTDNTLDTLTTNDHHGCALVLPPQHKRSAAALQLPLQIDTEQLRFAPQRPEGTSRVPGGVHDGIGGNKLAGIQVHHRG